MNIADHSVLRCVQNFAQKYLMDQLIDLSNFDSIINYWKTIWSNEQWSSLHFKFTVKTWAKINKF